MKKIAIIGCGISGLYFANLLKDEKLYDYTLNKYHAVNDEYDESWNLEGLEQNINTIFSISLQLANSNSWPNWYENNEFRAIRDLQLSKKSTP